MMVMFAKIGRIAWVSALSMPGEQPTVLYFFGLSDPRATAGLQRYASDWNSVQTYASESQLLGPSGPSEPSRNARKSLQTCALVVQTFGQSDKIVMLWARERAGSMEGSAFRWTDLPSRSSRIPRRKPTSIWIDFRGRRLPGGIRQRSCVRPRSRRINVRVARLSVRRPRNAAYISANFRMTRFTREPRRDHRPPSAKR
jgi:hypothetical protein